MKLLPQISLSILLALSLKPRHGYEIIKQVEIDSDSRIKMSPGTLYGAIDKLKQQKLISELTTQDSERRKYYQLTESGANRLASEMEYFAATLELARTRRTQHTVVIGFDHA